MKIRSVYRRLALLFAAGAREGRVRGVRSADPLKFGAEVRNFICRWLVSDRCQMAMTTCLTLIHYRPRACIHLQRLFLSEESERTVYLQSTLTQARLTHLTVINMNKMYLDRVCLQKILWFHFKDARASCNFWQILSSLHPIYFFDRPICMCTM